MIDRQQLEAAHKAALRLYWMIAATPVALCALGWWVAQGADSAAGSVSVSRFTIGLLTVFGLAAVIGVPLLRASWRRKLNSQSGQTALPGSLISHLLIQLALWEALAMIGFEAVITQESIAVLYGTTLVSTLGIAYSYPRWSDWQDTADAADRNGAQGPAV